MKKLIISIILAAVPFAANAQETLTLKKAVEKTLENNYSIRVVKRSGEIAENNYSIGNAGMLPRIDAVAGASYAVNDIEMQLNVGGGMSGPPSDTTSTGPMTIDKTGSATKNYNAAVELNWTLFDGFAMFANYEKLEELKKKSDIEIQTAIEGTIQGLINTYYEAVKMEQNLNAMEKTLQISRDRYKRAKDRKEYGSGSRIEVLNALVDLNADSSSYMQMKLAFENMIRNLNFMMGEDINADIKLNSEAKFRDLPDFENLKKIAFEKNSSLNQALKEKRISELDYKAATALYYPRINFKTSYSYTKQENDAGFMISNMNKGVSAGISANWNLYDGNRSNIATQNASVAAAMKELRYKQVKEQIELNLVNAYENYEQRLEIYEMEKENIKTAEANFERAESLFKLGQLTSIDFRQAQLGLVRAENRLNDAKYSAKVAESELLLLAGIYFE